MRFAPYLLFCTLLCSQWVTEAQIADPHLRETKAEADDVPDATVASELAELTAIYHDLEEWRSAIVAQTDAHAFFAQLQQSFEQANLLPIQFDGTKLQIDSDLLVAIDAFFLRESPGLTAAQVERIEPKQSLLLVAELWNSENERWAVLWSGKKLGFALPAYVKPLSAFADVLPYSCLNSKTLTVRSRTLIKQACSALKDWHEQVLHSNGNVAALTDAKRQLNATLEQAITLHHLAAISKPEVEENKLPPMQLTEVKDRMLKSINYGIRFYEDSLRLEKAETALQGAIKLEKMSTRYQAMREKIENYKQALIQRRNVRFTSYTRAVRELAKQPASGLNDVITEISRYLSTGCEQQILTKVIKHIRSYRNTQQVAAEQWREDLLGLEKCVP